MENTVKISVLEEQMKEVGKKIDSLDRKIEKEFEELKSEMCNYVRKEEFVTVKNLVYGMAGVILTAFITGVIHLVFK